MTTLNLGKKFQLRASRASRQLAGKRVKLPVKVGHIKESPLVDTVIPRTPPEA